MAFITGAARGQGRAHAIRLANEGADIIAIDVCRPISETITYPLATSDELAETVQAVEATGSKVLAREVDIRDLAALQQVVAGSEGAVRSGPTELWTDVWLALVAFAAERVGAREWQFESPQIGLTLDAAWDAIAAR